jgi:hypothetical protein
MALAFATAAPACRAGDDSMREIISNRMGVSVTDDFSHTFGIRGVLVLDAPNGSVGRRGGLKSGDLMLFFDGRPIRGIGDLAPQLVALDEGGRVGVEVYRRGRIQSLTLNLEPARAVIIVRDGDVRRIVIPHEDVKKLRNVRVAADSEPDLGDVLRDVGRMVGRTIERAIGRTTDDPADSTAGMVEVDMHHGIPDLGWQ